MLLDKVRRILEKEGGKCIVIEEGKSEYLVIEKRDFKEEEIDKVNRDIEEMKATEEMEKDFGEDAKEDDEVQVEDLPF